jgi:molybdopterin/thiamine biosynthesis adenylyltransferase
MNENNAAINDELSSNLTQEENELLVAATERAHEENTSTENIIEDNHVEIPINSETYNIDETTSRFSSATWFEAVQQKTIILAGLGGIGSFVAFLLSRMKPKSLFLYDNDIVESSNLSGQLYRMQDINEQKVDAINYFIRNYSNYNSAFSVPEKFSIFTEAADIMICGFDNMEARQTFFKVWENHVSRKEDTDRKNCLLIDGRLAAEEFQILCITGDDTYNIKRYKTEFLFNDSEADQTICSYKQTSFCASMIGSMMVNLFVNFIVNNLNPNVPRYLPFYTSYNAETLYITAEQ